MKSHLFKWKGSGSLPDVLARPLQGVSLTMDRFTKIESFSLWTGRRQGIQITSRMCNVAERLEVGVLQFEPKTSLLPDEKFIPLEPVNLSSQISKLLILENGITVESGVRFKFTSQQEVIVKPSDFPLFLAVDAIGIDLPQRLTAAEYPVDCYEVVDMAFAGFTQGA